MKITTNSDTIKDMVRDAVAYERDRLIEHLDAFLELRIQAEIDELREEMKNVAFHSAALAARTSDRLS